MRDFPILTFKPQFKSVIWGGKRIAEFKNMPPQGDKIGESWELSGVPGHESIVADGPYEGMNLQELINTHADEIMGTRLVGRFGHEFPLLIKLIDSADDLSVQVHPDDKLAHERHNCPGKTEMWVSIAPADGAYLYSGLRHSLTPDGYRKAIAENTIIDDLGKYYPEKDDVFFLPAGRIHSIGRGNFVLEIQETSDITYRIYDYDRRDAAGNPRQLHVEESVAAVNFNDTADAAPTHIPEGKDTEFVIADCDHFTTTALYVDGTYTIDLSKRDSFTIVTVTEGSASLIAPGGVVTELTQGQTALIPASMAAVTVKGNGRIISAYIK